jgi:hypothetical protein
VLLALLSLRKLSMEGNVCRTGSLARRPILPEPVNEAALEDLNLTGWE